MTDENPQWRDGAYYYVYRDEDGALCVIYYYHGMARGADTVSVFRCPVAA